MKNRITQTPEDKSSFITVMYRPSGFFAVLFWWNPEGFWEPMESSIIPFLTYAGALIEAEQWAGDEGVPVLVEA